MTTAEPAPAYTWTFPRVMWATLVLVAVAASFWLLYRFYQVVFVLFVSIVIGTVIRPVVTWLNRRGLPRSAGVILVYLALLLGIVGFVLVVFPLIFEQGATLAAAAPGYYQSMRAWAANSPEPLFQRLSQFLPATLPVLNPLGPTGEQVLESAGQAMRYIGSAAKVVFMALAILLLAFHWTIDGPRTIQSWLAMIPQDRRENIGELVSAMESKVGFYIAGQGVLCLVVGVMALAAYLLIGLPNAVVLAVVAGLLEAIPMVGPLLGAVPAAVIGLSISPAKFVWVVVATIVIQQLENSFLVPRVMRKAVGVNPFVTLVSIFAFSSLFGIAGAVMAIPLAAIIQLLLERFIFKPGGTEPRVDAGRNYASRLRYEAQELAQDLRKQGRLNREGSEAWVEQTDQVMEEIEAITTGLDSLLAQVPAAETT